MKPMKQYRPKKIKTGKGLLFGMTPDTIGGTKLASERVSQCTQLGRVDSRAGMTSEG